MSRRTILVMDDERQIRRAVRNALNGDDTRVVEAATGADALTVVNIAPALPRILGDPIRMREALSLLLGHRIEHTPAGDTVHIEAEYDRKVIRITVTHAPLPALGAEELLARRLTEAQGGQIETSGGTTEITLPVHALTGEMRAVG